MAGSLLTVHTVHTRVVRRRRADSRASTEPHANRAETVPDTTTPYRRDFQPAAEMESAGRDSLPYCELLVTSEVQTVRRAVTSEIETIERATVVLANGSGEVPAITEPPARERKPARDDKRGRADTQGRTLAAQMSWLGIAQCQPEVGSSLVIGTYARADFCVTSPVTHVFSREDGVLVQTATKSRYFVEPSGDAYLVRKAP